MEKDRNTEEIGNTISKKEAKEMVKRYQKENPEGTHGWLFGRDILLKLMAYNGSRGIWFYKGLNEKGQEQLVMYPADEKGNILDKSNMKLSEFDELPDSPGDRALLCPPRCPGSGDL